MDEQQKMDQELNHEYDGIREYDNPLPRWWLTTFFGTIVFTFGYWGYYHVVGLGMLPQQALAVQTEQLVAQQNAAAAHIDDNELISMSKDPNTIASGKVVFTQNCVACHGDRGQGGIGPNLTDAYWIHGGSPMQIRHTIENGVLEKGMTAWKSVLGDKKINEVVAFLLTIRNTNVPGKAPQGNLEDGTAGK